MHSYFLVDDGQSMPRWCELSVDEKTGARVWVDFKGRRRPFSDVTAIARVEGENIQITHVGVPAAVAEYERNAAYRYLLDPWSNQGWIRPDGRFFGCAFYAHDDMAYALLRMHPATLEFQGWVRVHDDSFRMGVTTREMTRRQEETLIALGFDDPIPGYRRNRLHEPDRSQPPPRFAAKPPTELAPSPGLPPVAIVFVSVPQQAEPRIMRAPAAAPKPDPDVVALDKLARKLAQAEGLQGLFEQAPEHIPDVGPGTWMWMLQFDELTLGGPEHPDEILAAKGMHLCVTSFDTIEVSAWPFAEIKIDEGAAAMIELRRTRSPAL